jgi:O-methyltransferase domain
MHILHDWDDNSAGTILRAIRATSPANATILILETIMPDQPGPHWAKLLDIQMLTMHTGRESTRVEYAKLLADEKFCLERVIETRSDVKILEAIPV